MKKLLGNIGFGILKGILKALAMLPLRVLYAMSWMIYLLMRHVVHYRVKMVRKNLRNSFPEADDDTLRKYEHEFYHNFADYIVETIKLLHISDKEMRSRFRFNNMEAIERHIAEGKSVVCYYAHFFNWEWGSSFPLDAPDLVSKDVDCNQIYRPLSNKHFDALMLHLRSRFGAQSLAKALALRTFVRERRDGKLSVTGFMSDQKPSHGDAVHVVNFLNQPTRMITGTEQLARRLGMAVVYWDMRKTSRGHYEVDIVDICDDASQLPEYQLTDTYARLLERTIRRQPPIWLWTHNRWKQLDAKTEEPGVTN